MSWLGLEEKEQVAVFLSLFVVWEEAFLQFEAFCEMVCDFVLLQTRQFLVDVRGPKSAPLPTPCDSE